MAFQKKKLKSKTTNKEFWWVNLPTEIAVKDKEIAESGLPVFYSEEFEVCKGITPEYLEETTSNIFLIKEIFGSQAAVTYAGKEKDRGWQREWLNPYWVSEAKARGRRKSMTLKQEKQQKEAKLPARKSKKRVRKDDEKATVRMFEYRQGYGK